MLDPRSAPSPSPAATDAAEWRLREAASVKRVRELMAARRAAALGRATPRGARGSGAPLMRLPRPPKR